MFRDVCAAEDRTHLVADPVGVVSRGRGPDWTTVLAPDATLGPAWGCLAMGDRLFVGTRAGLLVADLRGGRRRLIRG